MTDHKYDFIICEAALNIPITFSTTDVGMDFAISNVTQVFREHFSSSKVKQMLDDYSKAIELLKEYHSCRWSVTLFDKTEQLLTSLEDK